MRPYRMLLALLLVCLGFAACAGEEEAPPGTTIRIGVSQYDQYDTFISELMGHFTTYAQELEQELGITITIIRENADNSQEAQNNQVQSLIEAGCDVLCINLVDRTDVAVIIDKAEAAGLPIIFFNRELVEEDLARSDRLYYVGAEAWESGRLQGQLVIDLWEQKEEKLDKNGDGILQYVMLEGEKGHQDAIVRTEYSVAQVADAGIVLERLEDEIANWMRAQAETMMLRWLEVHGDAIEVVFANNDDMALGALDALKRAQVPFERWPAVVGVDGTSVGLEAVALGEMAGTVYNDAKGQARGMLDIAVALTTGGELPALSDGKYLRLPYQLVTAENVMQYLGE